MGRNTDDNLVLVRVGKGRTKTSLSGQPGHG